MLSRLFRSSVPEQLSCEPLNHRICSLRRSSHRHAECTVSEIQSELRPVAQSRGRSESMFRLRNVGFTLSLLSIMVAAGCGGGSTNNNGGSGGGGTGGSGGQSGPTVANFSVSPSIAGTGANGVGQFVNFNWTTTNATAINVTPNIAPDDQTLPLQGPFQDTGAPSQTTTFTATATNGNSSSQPATTTLTVVPVTLSASAQTHSSRQRCDPDLRWPEQRQLVVVEHLRAIPIPRHCPHLPLYWQHLHRNLRQRAAEHDDDIFCDRDRTGRRAGAYRKM